MQINYFTSWYNEPNEKRREELIKCIRNTINGGEVDSVFLLIDDNADITIFENKVHPIYLKQRPTYNVFFDVANKVCIHGDIAIIANTDIYPEAGTRKLLQEIGFNDCYALARYDIQEDESKALLDRWDSQDIWIFKMPIKKIEGDFYAGYAGCDNAIAERIDKAHYNISNPSRTIKFNHLHTSQVHNYNPDHKIPKPYLLITPHQLGEIPKLHCC